MKKYNRRNFIENSARGLAAAGFITASSFQNTKNPDLGSSFVHHVFFWLKKPVTDDVRKKFETALKKLVKVETITGYQLGVPAPTGRDVIDNTYSYSLLTTFGNKADQDIYQTHPIHLEFIKECQDLWEKVIVYDSVSF